MTTHQGDLKAAKEKISHLIAKNRIEDALDVIASIGKFNETINNEFILLSSRFFNYKDALNLGISDENNLNKTRNEISKSLIDLTNKIDENSFTFFIENTEIVRELYEKIKIKDLEILEKQSEVESLLNIIKDKDLEILGLLENIQKNTEKLEVVSKKDINLLTTIDLLKMGEGQQMEFKSAFHNKNIDSIAKTIVGFINARGGIILIGVNDNGEIIGINIDESHFRDFHRILFQFLSTKIGKEFLYLIHFETIAFENKILFRIDCEQSSIPVFYKEYSDNKEEEKFFVRMGAENVYLSKTMEVIQYIQLRTKN